MKNFLPDALIEKIYLEEDVARNLALFVGAVTSGVIYLLSKDVFIGFVFFIASFSVSKIILKHERDSLLEEKTKMKKISSFSSNEKTVISEFIKNGTCFISVESPNISSLNKPGLDSLQARSVIHFVDSMYFGDNDVGFALNEEIYKLFLQEETTV